MPEIALHTVLKAGREEDYDRIHRRIPDDLAQALREAGARDWRIWRDGVHVFHLVDVEDYAAMRHLLAAHPANVAWQAALAPLFDIADSYAGDDTGLAPVWSLTAQE